MSEPAHSANETGAGAGPVARGERLVALDFIRGVAVLGILFANIVDFAQPRLAYWWPGAFPDGGTAGDRWTWLVQLVLIDGKMRGLFTLLFGAGLALFVDRVRAGGGTGALQMRRLVLLAGFGLAHFYLLFTGDILFLYAVAGFVALAFVDMAPRALLRLGLAWYFAMTCLDAYSLLPAAAQELGWAWPAASSDMRALTEAGWQARLARAQAEMAAMSGGSFAGLLRFRADHEGYLLLGYAMVAFVDTVPTMLIGMALYRLGLFAQRFDPRRTWRWGWAGVAASTLATLPLGLWVMGEGFPPQLTSLVANGLAEPLRLPMILGLAALLTVLAPRAADTGLGARLVAAGRMAFSNYVGTSLVMALVFQGWAGGLYGRLHRLELLPFVLLGWLLMLAWSRPWLERFRYGPLEWLWRCLTYGRWFTLKR